jgi:hypothetical protein
MPKKKLAKKKTTVVKLLLSPNAEQRGLVNSRRQQNIIDRPLQWIKATGGVRREVGEESGRHSGADLRPSTGNKPPLGNGVETI